MTAALTLVDIAHDLVRHGTNRRILAPISCGFDAGHLYALSGPSGVGKSTLLAILSLTLRSSHGHLYWGAQDLTAIDTPAQARWRRRHLGTVFETNQLIGVLTVQEHLRLVTTVRGSPRVGAEGLKTLERLGMRDKLDRRSDQLSGGERQRVRIAQALCFRPSLLLLDEPTAFLDAGNAGRVLDLLRSFARREKAIVVCASNDPAVISAADHKLSLAWPDTP